MKNELITLEEKLIKKIEQINFDLLFGKIISIKGIVVEAKGLDISIGEIVKFTHIMQNHKILGQVVAVHEKSFSVIPFGSNEGLNLNYQVSSVSKNISFPISKDLVGRVLDAFGSPLDNKNPLRSAVEISKGLTVINPLDRTPITQTLITGVKAIDLFTSNWHWSTYWYFCR